MDASQAAVLRRQQEWEAEDAAVLRRQRSGKRKRRREREGVAGCDLATEEELGELWNFGGRRLWNWFHGGRKQPNGWVELGKHGHLRHNFKGSSESSWWRRGDNGGLLLCFRQLHPHVQTLGARARRADIRSRGTLPDKRRIRYRSRTHTHIRQAGLSGAATGALNHHRAVLRRLQAVLRRLLSPGCSVDARVRRRRRAGL